MTSTGNSNNLMPHFKFRSGQSCPQETHRTLDYCLKGFGKTDSEAWKMYLERPGTNGGGSENKELTIAPSVHSADAAPGEDPKGRDFFYSLTLTRPPESRMPKLEKFPVPLNSMVSFDGVAWRPTESGVSAQASLNLNNGYVEITNTIKAGDEWTMPGGETVSVVREYLKSDTSLPPWNCKSAGGSNFSKGRKSVRWNVAAA
ncbi:hypothetical protein I302_101729 [Kwoniella bestiolae CBS 10118]|uniref:Uncharacterized protein n=1 Tax=Kwoniella bestiolae CBS 10118 TaxID=1296100 RepID=A0A1B9GD21_9TREE|nr:hypothetical protein I302_00405 [Kwoniella bestiolae CBS 10118]OCF28915.1 hypothetical protein I302_00405 [Kwoniella bestiolae CBS 10118]